MTKRSSTIDGCSITHANFEPRIRARSAGVKLMVICLLALAMNIPGLFVQGLVTERMNRAAEAAARIGGPLTQIHSAFRGAGVSYLLHVRGDGRQTRAPRAVRVGGDCADHLLSAAVIDHGKGRIRPGILDCGRSDGGAAIDQREMGFRELEAGRAGLCDFSATVCADLHFTAAEGLCAACG